MALAFAPFGQEVVVKDIRACGKIRHHLNNLGIISGSVLVPLSCDNGNVIFKLKEGKLAINRGLANHIMVEVL